MSDLSLRIERQPQLLRQRVSERLREAIYEMRFPPGSRLIERELCELTGVSRTIIREALRELEGEGLVRLTPRGPIVSLLTAEEVRDIYDVRAALEGLAGRACAERAAPESVRALRAALLEIEIAYKNANSSASEKLAAKSRFYESLFAGARNETLSGLLRVLHGRINLLRAAYTKSSRTAQSLAEIRRIVRAVEKRDGDAAWQRCVEHVENAALVALSVMRDRERHANDRSG